MPSISICRAPSMTVGMEVVAAIEAPAVGLDVDPIIVSIIVGIIVSARPMIGAGAGTSRRPRASETPTMAIAERARRVIFE